MAGKRGKRLVKYVSDYVVFDLETTGFYCDTDRIIEISALKVQKKAVTDTFSTLVNPQCAIPERATQVNGITDDMVADAPLIQEALEQFFCFIGTDVLVGHNIHAFDLKFIQREAEALFGKTVENDYIDTLYMARHCLPGLDHHRLTDLAEYFHVDTSGAHRALNDCMMNYRCYEKMAQLQEETEILICPECGGELMKRKGRYGMFFGCSNYPECRYTKNIASRSRT